MSAPSGPPSFLDRKNLLAILLIGGFFLGWQFYLQKKYPNMYDKKTTTAETNQQVKETAAGAVGATKGNELAQDIKPKNDELGEGAVAEESFVRFEDERMSFDISSKGMGLSSVVLKKYTDRSNEPITYGRVDGRLPFETRLTGREQSLDFQIEKVGETRFVGVATFGDLKITKSLEVNTEKYILSTKVNVQGDASAFLGLTTSMSISMEEQPESSFFLPQFAKQEFLVLSGGSEERVHITQEEPIEENFAKVALASVGDQYFSQAVVDRSDVIPDIKVRSKLGERAAWAEMNYPSLGKSNGFTVAYDSFVGPKYLDLLESVDANLAGVIDYGMFSWLAKKILYLLKWFHDLVGNWGVAIILLTVFVRVLVMPLYVMSYRSMNKMKAIQPKIQALRERFKDDPTRMNQEMMVLMRENKVNPVGGCLPMLLQFPVFIALYQVLGQSIELYQAPFFGWVHDLSLKDPFYIFPALMGVTMFFQQKLTPTTLDPVQAKVLMFMPLIFTFFMIGLPSGLTLYIFISALVGIVQQLIFMKQDQPTVVTAK